MRKDGILINASVSLSPIKDAEGKVVAASKIVRDITERKRAEERFRLVVEAAPNAMIMVDAKGTITLVNAQTEAVFHYSRQELIGKPIEALVPDRFHPHHPAYRNGFFGDPRARAMG